MNARAQIGAAPVQSLDTLTITGLAFASLVTWTIWLAKTVELLLISREGDRGSFRLARAAE